MTLNVLVTGASGFIGSRLVKALKKNGHNVTAIVHKNEIMNSSIKKIQTDLTDTNFEIPNEEFDVVFHLAAVTPLEKNKKILKKVNYEGTVNFFNKIKRNVKFLVYVSGLGIFGNPGSKIVDENSPLKPDTEYSKIRLEAQNFLEDNCKQNSIPFTVTYLGEVYGNGGWFADQIVNRIKSGKFRMPKGGDYYRNFVHVDDVVSALVEIGEKNIQNESFIITDSNPILFKDFINYVCDLLGKKHPGSVPVFLAKTVMGGDFVKLLTTSIKSSNKKIANLIKFQYPSYQEGLKKVISEIKDSG